MPWHHSKWEATQAEKFPAAAGLHPNQFLRPQIPCNRNLSLVNSLPSRVQNLLGAVFDSGLVMGNQLLKFLLLTLDKRCSFLIGEGFEEGCGLHIEQGFALQLELRS